MTALVMLRSKSTSSHSYLSCAVKAAEIQSQEISSTQCSVISVLHARPLGLTRTQHRSLVSLTKYTVVGKEKSAAAMEDGMESSQKSKNRKTTM